MGRKFYVGQKIVIDDLIIDRLCAKPDMFMSIPELKKQISLKILKLIRSMSFQRLI